MTDRLFSAALTFLLLAGGTFAVGSELLGRTHAAAAQRPQSAVVELPCVAVTGRRADLLVATGRGSNPAGKTVQ
jgi:hypothetical protein